MNEQHSTSTLGESIIKTLLYFDLFHYPLTASEIFQYLQTNHTSEREVKVELTALEKQSLIYNLGSFFSVENNAELEVRRIQGNANASQSMQLALKQATLISSFPFVRAVMISGSLSKGYMDEKSDLDFFIVTENERLWIARTLLVLYKRIFLSNSHKYFCVNYFVDSIHLEIEEKNLFTATELATLIPVLEQGFYSTLLTTNKWLWSFFPNYTPRAIPRASPSKETNRKKALTEWVINRLFARQWNKFLMVLTQNRWNKKYQAKYAAPDFEVAFKTRKHVSKNHPNNYQRKIMELYKEKLNSFAKQHQLTWYHE